LSPRSYAKHAAGKDDADDEDVFDATDDAGLLVALIDRQCGEFAFERFDQRPDVAVAVDPPDVHAVRAKLRADALVARHDDVPEEAHGDERAALVADVLPAPGEVEGYMRQQGVEVVLDQQAAGFDHVLDHLGVIVHRVGQALEAQHVAHAADHRTAPDSQGVVAGRGVILLDSRHVDLAAGVVAVEPLGLDAFPILGRDDRRFGVVRNRAVAVFGRLGQQTVAVHVRARGGGFGDDLVLEGRADVHVPACAAEAVEVEEDVCLPLLPNVIFLENGPPVVLSLVYRIKMGKLMG